MKVKHSCMIRSQSPFDGAKDIYQCHVWPNQDQFIKCEDILAAIQELTMDPVNQEDLTQRLANKLDCIVRTIGDHCGGDVRTKVTCRGEDNPILEEEEDE